MIFLALNTAITTSPALPMALSNEKLYGVVGILFLIIVVFITIFAKRDKTPDNIKKLLLIKFPSSWREILIKEFPIYDSLPSKIQENLNRYIQVFIGTKDFQGVDDLEITQEMRLSIAAQASLLVCNVDFKFQCYEKFGKTFVYPERFPRDSGSSVLVDGVSIPPMVDGESFLDGEVFLSWKDVKEGVANGEDGYNPVFHQFAHQLDQADYEGNGVPSMLIKDSDTWKKVWNSYFRKFKVQVSQGKTTVMDPSATENLSEFFAVATEFFFESPIKFKKESPGLYNELTKFYNQDPAGYQDHKS
jgi:MtfA peptidase